MMKLKRSKFCDTSACVEVTMLEDQVLVNSTSSMARFADFTPDEWKIFVLGVKAGEFDWPEEGIPV